MRTIEKVRDIFTARGYNLLSEEYHSNKEYLIFEKDGYYYYNTLNGFTKTDNPKKWSIRNPYSLQNLQKYLNEQGATCVVLSQEYDYNCVRLKCECGNEYEVDISNLLRTKQYKCPSCGRKSMASKHRKDELYFEELDKYKLKFVDENEYKGVKNHYYFITKDGYYTKTNLYNLAKGADFRRFIFDPHNKFIKENIDHFAELQKTRSVFVSAEFKGSKTRYKFKCECGEEFYHTWRTFKIDTDLRCPKCRKSISTIELKVKVWLDENAIEYETQKTFAGCGKKRLFRFDFYLPVQNKLIEVDGEQHFKPVYFGNKKTSPEKIQENFLKGQERDKVKNKFCEDNHIPLLRISYTDFNEGKYKEILKTFISQD